MLSIVTVLLASAWVIQISTEDTEATTLYFERNLSERRYSGQVHVGNATLTFKNGQLLDAAPSKRERAVAARVAYAAALAEQEPLFALPYDDLAKLRRAVNEVETLVGQVSGIQATPLDEFNVRNNLYPIAFLNNLIDLEEKRRAFIKNPSRATQAIYKRGVFSVIRSGERAIRDFSVALKTYTQKERFSIQLPGGKVTNASLQAAADGITARFSGARHIARERSSCLRGTRSSCTPPLRATPVSHSPAIYDHDITPEVLRVYSDAYGMALYGSERVVTLTKSACLGAPGRVHDFVLAVEGDTPVRLKYVSDIFFLKTDSKNARTLQHMREAYGVRFSRIEPAVYYNCPDSLHDLSLVSNVLRAARFAESHTDVAPEKRPLLLGQYIHQADAEAYIRDAMENIVALDPDAQNELLDIALIFNGGTSGLDSLVQDIANVLAIDIALKKKGVPFDLSAQNLFLTHSALTSLFLGHDVSTGLPEVSAIESSEVATSEIMQKYSEMRITIPRDVILENIRSTARFEGTLKD